MVSSFDIANLSGLLRDFYITVGIRISIFDDSFRLVTEYPVEAPEFCSNIRQSEEGRQACKACDEAAFRRAKKLRKPHIYTCHAGITEAITPIQIGEGVLGYAILAHIFPIEHYQAATENACTLAEKYGISKEISRNTIKGITIKSEEQITAAVKILDAVSSYLYIQNLAQWKNEDISSGIEKYIKENLNNKITSEDICKRFNCSRATLYNISMKAFGMGIMQYVNYRRMEKAKLMLSKGITIAETADQCGFSDYNHFCKQFKKFTGLSPGQYKKQGNSTVDCNKRSLL